MRKYLDDCSITESDERYNVCEGVDIGLNVAQDSVTFF